MATRTTPPLAAAPCARCSSALAPHHARSPIGGEEGEDVIVLMKVMAGHTDSSTGATSSRILLQNPKDSKDRAQVMEVKSHQLPSDCSDDDFCQSVLVATRENILAKATLPMKDKSWVGEVREIAKMTKNNLLHAMTSDASGS